MHTNIHIQNRISFYRETEQILSKEKVDYLCENGLMPLSYNGDYILKMLHFLNRNAEQIKTFDKLKNRKLFLEVMRETRGCVPPPMVLKEIEDFRDELNR